MNTTNEMRIVTRMVREKPDLRTLGVTMLPRIEAFALELQADPEKMRAFEEWKRERKCAAAS